MQSIRSVCIFKRLKQPLSAVATGIAASGALVLCGCGSGLHGTAASAGVPVTALTVSAAPKLGYAWNETDATLRPITGVPGSAQFGESVTPAGAYQLGVADPGGNFALLLGDSQTIYRMTLPSGTPVLLAWQAAEGSTIRISPQGAAALVFLPGATGGTLLTQLSGTAAGKSVPFPGAIVEAAVSDSGNVAVAYKSSGGVSVQVAPFTGHPTTVSPVQGFGGMSFIAGTDDLLLADSGANSLTRIRSASTSPTPSPLPTSGLLKSPVSVAASLAAHWAVIANGADASVVRVDLSGATPAQRSVCSCQPSVVARLASDSAFRLTSLNTGPVWISDASNPAFPVLFIPAVAAEAKAAGK
jgi:hypothetical protein